MPDEEYSIMSKGIVKKEMVDEAVACPCSPPAPAPRAHPSPAPIPRTYGCVARAWRPNLRPREVYLLLKASTGKQWGSAGAGQFLAQLMHPPALTSRSP